MSSFGIGRLRRLGSLCLLSLAACAAPTSEHKEPEPSEPPALQPLSTLNPPPVPEPNRGPFAHHPAVFVAFQEEGGERPGPRPRLRLRESTGAPQEAQAEGPPATGRSAEGGEGTQERDRAAEGGAGEERPRPRIRSRQEAGEGARPREVPPQPEVRPREEASRPESVEEAQAPPHFEPIRSRWTIQPPEYEINEQPHPLNPYRQNVLKGDYPIMGEDIFLSLTFTERALVEGRRVPTPTGITGPERGREEFFGEGEQFFFQNFAIAEADLFKGQQAFKPVDWRLKASLVYNVTHLDVQETGVVNVNVAKGTDRTSDYVALQSAIAEIHLLDLSDRYDFLSFEAGILPFRSDFRGFVFDDVNLGARLFGNADSNRWQYNLLFFDPLEKDTNSELNRFRDRHQFIAIANVYRQDWPFLGYTTSLSVHYNHDEADVHFDRNGFLVRPAPVGLAQKHRIDAVYLGWAGEGHIGRINVTHAFYQVLGEDTANPFAGKETDINAQLAALEVSYDIDWLRLRAFVLYASGDGDPRDDDARGFDGILEAPNFAGGQFSFFNRQAIRLVGVNLTQRLSPYADLQTSKFEGQSNFVNPGLILAGPAIDVEVTPTLRAMVGGSYLMFDRTAVLEQYLFVEDVDDEIGWEVFVGAQYRPLLTNNIILTAGFAPFFPGAGFKKIYQSSEVLFSGFFDLLLTW